MQSLPNDNLSYPVLIEISGTSGSGFYLNFEGKNVYLVTAYHVLFDPQTKKARGTSATLTSYDNVNRKKSLIFNVDLNGAKIISDALRDTAMILMSKTSLSEAGDTVLTWETWVKPIKHDGSETIVTVDSSNLKRFDDVLESNDVFILVFQIHLVTPDKLRKIDPFLEKESLRGKIIPIRQLFLTVQFILGTAVAWLLKWK